MTQWEFAERCGCTQPDVSRWVGNYSRPSPRYIAIIEAKTRGKVTLRDWLAQPVDPRETNRNRARAKAAKDVKDAIAALTAQVTAQASRSAADSEQKEAK